MQITNTPISYNTLTPHKKTTNFSGNPNSPKLVFHNKDFFINMPGYGKNQQWVEVVKTVADNAVRLIREGKTADEVLQEIAKGIRLANKNCDSATKAYHSGILRTSRKGYGDTGIWAGRDIYTPFGNEKTIGYNMYTKRLKETITKPLKSPYTDVDLTTINKNGIYYEMKHGDALKINNTLDRVGGKYFNLKRNFISQPEKVTEETLNGINSEIAEIRWLMAHATPWERGSDAISNTFMRAMYKSMGIQTFPSKKGVSFDLEAFCTNLPDYQKNFANLFEKPPKVIE